uniref:Dual specificity protein phosphatase 22 n=1 Tax=Leptobrachium leishanense TaxID=445787 RepID=A0A8C5QAD0_9ANUR
MSSSYEVLQGLYLGNIRDSEDKISLCRNGVTHILSVHNNTKPLLQEMSYLCITASDSANQNLMQHFKKCIRFIHESRLHGGGCLVHCLAGVSRSTTIVVAYLMTVTNLGWEDCLSAVKCVRSYVDPNFGFQQQLQEYQMNYVMEMCDRNTGRRLRQWLIEQIDSGCYPGLVWENDEKSLFRIPWKHAGKQDYNQEVDASIFKAWAVFKGKFKEGDKAEPATWKTRLRCALNKSPDFEEVTDRSQLDISEPYKVYRIVPEEEQKGKPAGANMTEVTDMECSSTEIETSSDDYLAIIKRSPSPAKDTCQKQTSQDWWIYPPNSGVSAMEVYPTYEPVSHAFSQMIISFFYGGKMVSQITTSRIEGCRISLGHHITSGEKVYNIENLENIRFPSADYITSERQKQITRKLFGHLDRGVLLFSSKQGVFIKRLCQGRVFWSGNCMPYKDRPNKLERDELVKIFDTNLYLRELQHCYSQGRFPESRITLCFGEEFPDATPLQLKLIIVQIEQLSVRQLAEEAVKSYSSASLHLHPDPPMDQIPRIMTDACTTHQRSFYRENQQITV